MGVNQRVMFINHDRQKLINAIIYFSTNTQYLHKIKLFKLLYFLDFEHFKQTGRSVTGLDYFAWPKGPVPVTLFEEIKESKPDMSICVSFKEAIIKKGKMLEVTPLVDFDSRYFSKRELRILEDLSKEYFDTLAEDMIEATHLENQPWHKIYHEQNQKQVQIPYELAIRRQEFAEVHDLAKERDELIKNFG